MEMKYVINNIDAEMARIRHHMERKIEEGKWQRSDVIAPSADTMRMASADSIPSTSTSR